MKVSELPRALLEILTMAEQTTQSQLKAGSATPLTTICCTSSRTSKVFSMSRMCVPCSHSGKAKHNRLESLPMNVE